MTEKMTEKKKISLYVLILFIVSYILEGIIILNRGVNKSYIQTLVLVLMLFPSIAAIIYVIVTKEGFKNLGLKIKKPIYLLYGIFIPVIITIMLVLLFIGLGWGKSKFITYSNGNIVLTKIPTIISSFTHNKPQSVPIFILDIIITSIFTSIRDIPYMLGEELGWRGFLQNKLIAKFGTTSGIIILGLIWAMWHTPLILAGLLNYPKYPVIGAFVLFPISCIALSFIMGWLRLASQSVWPCAFAHAAFDDVFGIFFIGGPGMKFSVSNIVVDIFVLIILIIAGIFCFWRIKKIEKRGELYVGISRQVS